MSTTMKLGPPLREEDGFDTFFPAYGVTCPKCKAYPFRPFMRGIVYRSIRLGFGGFADVFDIVKHWVRREHRPTSCLICWDCKEIVGHE